MTDRLEAWLEGRHAGAFVFADDGQARFEYAEDAPATPVSLSLPRDRPATRRAAINYLENLLPDSARTRERMAIAYGARSSRVFDLLLTAGGDVAGGLVLTPEGQEPGTSPPTLNPALEGDVAARIAATRRTTPCCCDPTASGSLLCTTLCRPACTPPSTSGSRCASPVRGGRPPRDRIIGASSRASSSSTSRRWSIS